MGGWWTLVPLGIAAVCFAAADRLIDRTAKPEFAIAAAWVTSQLLIAASIALTGGIDSAALDWLAIPVVTLAARFDARALSSWMRFYNRRRPHTAAGGRAPITRVHEVREQNT